MSDYTRINQDAIDLTIFDRVSEADVRMWLAAKLELLRQAGLKAHNILMCADFRSYKPSTYYDASITIHGDGFLALNRATLATAITESVTEAKGIDLNEVSKKRWKGRHLLESAAAMEAQQAEAGRIALDLVTRLG